jgi:hypothetical protein
VLDPKVGLVKEVKPLEQDGNVRNKINWAYHTQKFL